MEFKINYFTLSILWFMNVIVLVFFKTYDVDFNLTSASLSNYIIIITLIYALAMLVVAYFQRKHKMIVAKQIKVMFEDDYIIDEYRDDELINSIYRKVIKLKHSILMQNEEQNKWVHDVKIPLSTLNMFIDNQRGIIEYEKLKTLELISLDIETSINKKIMFDKIELEIDDFKIERFDLRALFIEVIKKYRPSFMLKDLAIEVDLLDVYIVSDQKSIKYCLEQIIANAIKYADRSTKISVYMSGSNVLCIEDIGSPINSQDINRLFEKGYTGVNSQDSGLASTGIGLYMVKKSLTYLNHDIWIENDYKTTKVMINFKNVTKM